MKINLSLNAEKVIDNALKDAQLQNHEFVTPEHLLMMALSMEEVVDLLVFCNADIDTLFFDLKSYLDDFVPKQKTKLAPSQSIGFKSVISSAIIHCQNADKPSLDLGDLLVSLYDEDSNHCAFLMRKAGIKRITLLQAITSMRNAESLDSTVGPNAIQMSRTIPSKIHSQNNTEETPEPQSEPKKQKKSLLQEFTTNITEMAKQNKLSKIIGREQEIQDTIQVLCRKKKNNPIHLGEPGVGKTAITEALAQKIIQKEVPDFLFDFEIFELDMSSVLAGTKFRGDFEERLKGVCKELKEHKKAILFIDEIHSLIGTGTGNNGGYDAANILKPFLTAGEVRCIGATTYEEYKKAFIKDKALARRFQQIDIKEPTEEETFKILKGIQADYEDFHKVTYSDKALQHAIHLSNLYINERFLPDKAIDVIDEAGSKMRIENAKNASNSEPTNSNIVIAEKQIEQIIAKIAHIPEQKVSENETEKLRNLTMALKTKIFGQDEAIQKISIAIKRARAGLRAKDKPVANFLFVGPTGVGKTALAKALSQELGIAIHRFDMSEYQEKHSVSRLIGSPPGYVGFEDGGLLTDAVRKAPHAVLLLDEIEKAHSSIFNILLQMMDYATLTDNQGRKADFRNIILILTSNAGAAQIGKPIIGFGGKEFSDTAIDTAVENTFSPEFRNRLDAIIKFNPLNMNSVKQIIKSEIEKINIMLKEKNYILDCSEDLINYFVEKGYNPEFGARNISRLIESELITPIVDLMLFESNIDGGKIKCYLDKNGKITINSMETSIA